MRICLYTGSALPKLGGQEAVVDALARHLQRLGHEPTVLAPRPRLPLRPRDGGLPYRVVRHPRFYSTEVGVDWYRWFLLRAHRRHRFDVVHCHDVYPTGYVAAACRERMGVPVVITSHGGDIRAGSRLLAKPKVYARIDRALDAADGLIAISRFTAEAFGRFGEREPDVCHIPNGVDLDAFRPPAARPGGLDPGIRADGYVLFIGRLAARKGVDTLLAAVADARPASGVDVVIAGSGAERDALGRLAADRGVADRVRFVGRVDGDVKRYLLQNAAAVAMPSRDWEAFPLVVLEAYAAGRPVLASRIPGLVDLVDDGVTGVLVPPEDVAGWSAVLTRSLHDPRWRAAAGATARATAAAYDWPVIAARHVALYDRLRAGQTAS